MSNVAKHPVRLTTRTIDLGAGYFVVKFVSASEPDAASVSIGVLAGQQAQVRWLGDNDHEPGFLKQPGTMVVVRCLEPVTLIATIQASAFLLKPNVRIDVERLHPTETGPAAPPAPSEPLAAPAAPATPSLPVRLPAWWVNWPNKPEGVLLSMSVAYAPNIWSAPKLAENVTLANREGVWGLRFALIGQNHASYILVAHGTLADGQHVEASGQNVLLPRGLQQSLTSAKIYVLDAQGRNRVCVSEWRRGT
jgi:hypothetical protein